MNAFVGTFALVPLLVDFFERYIWNWYNYGNQIWRQKQRAMLVIHLLQ